MKWQRYNSYFMNLRFLLFIARITEIVNRGKTCLEEFEDTKGIIRIHIFKKDKQHNGQKKNDNDLQNTIQKNKDRTTRTRLYNIPAWTEYIYFLHTYWYLRTHLMTSEHIILRHNGISRFSMNCLKSRFLFQIFIYKSLLTKIYFIYQ